MGSTSNMPQSWGHYPQVETRQVTSVYWLNELPDLASFEGSVLPFAYGRSYGDSCLNADGVALDVTHLNRFIAFDDQNGILRCEAGVSLAEVLKLIVPRGWFLPVTPGTKFISVGGAIANDVHGKNHHRGGTFGRYVTRFELLRSDGQRLLCSPTENADLFRATIGGLGLTGVILWAEFSLKPIANPFIDMERIRYSTLEEFLDISAASEHDFEYTVAWIDCLAGAKQLGKGLFIRGNHNRDEEYRHKPLPKKLPLLVPFNLPSFTLNKLTVKAFNTVIYHSQLSTKIERVIPYEPFFYPLDSIHEWNRIYGKSGFLQYQCVVPMADGCEIMRDILGRISRSGEGSFLVVLKTFGDTPSPGLLSFPRPGITLALDFSFHGKKTLQLCEELDAVVRTSGGSVYPAKDARMTAESFQAYFPQWHEFEQYIDPKFSSSFWRRVTPPARVTTTSRSIG